MKCIRHVLGIILVIVVMTAGLVVAAEEQPLCNADIIKLTKLAMGDDLIITKIKTAKAVKFDIATDDLIKLKESGVSGQVMAAMLARSAVVAEIALNKGVLTPKVTLVAKEGTFDIKPIVGDLKTVVAPFVGARRYFEYFGAASGLRIKDRAPKLLLSIDHDPHNVWWLVKVSPWGDKIRVLDMQSGGGFGGTFSSAPDESCNIQYNAVEEKPGTWRITPAEELKPGEYGMFRASGYGPAGPMNLADFGIDQ